MNKPICHLLFFLFVIRAPESHAQPAAVNDLRETLSRTGDDILVVAHRGHWRQYPENSLPAIQSCIDLGADIVEIDVRMTQDGQIVVIHDKTLDRTTTGTGKVTHHTLADIQKLSLKNGYGLSTQSKVPTLEEVLRLTKDKAYVMIDKAYYLLPQVWAVVEQTGTQKQVFFEGKAPYQEIKKKYPDLTGKIYYVPRISAQTHDLAQYISDFNTHKEPMMFIASFEEEDPEFLAQVKYLNGKGVVVMGSTLWGQSCAGHTDDQSMENPDKGWGWMYRKGFRALCTDRPRELLMYKNKRNSN